jgi:ubiquinone/menaquinone biosynthesis C-methylase UbiE
MPSAVSHRVFARAFPAMSRALEADGIAGRRKDLLAGLAGQVIDVGAGTGPSFGHYPAAVTRVLGVEPEPRLRAVATAAAQAAPVPVEVTSGVADALPADDASHDAAVVSFILCTVPDQDAALAEIHRVLRPGGTLCFLEHVRADTPGLVRISARWRSRYGRTCLAAAISAATPPLPSSAPASQSQPWRSSVPRRPHPGPFHIAGHGNAPGQ